MTTPWNSSAPGSYGGPPGPQQQPGHGGPPGPPAYGGTQQGPPHGGPPGGGWQGPPSRQANPGAALGWAGVGAGIVLGPVGLVLGVMSFTRSRRAGASTVPGVIAMIVGTVWTVAVAAIVVVTAVVTLSQDPPPPPEPTQTETEPETPGPAAGENPGDTDTEREVRDVDIDLGNCIDDLENPVSPGTFLHVPCAQPHHAEVVAEYTITEPDFPGTDAVQQQADDFCSTEVPEALPTEIDRTNLTVYYLYPTQTTWDDGDRIISCFVLGKDDTRLVGSAIAGDIQISE
ncbi:hypothetical protein Bcav_3650 [Beutenbergia cavernae DSM 12333]|uniref:Septum formation-related domain-containing protein n=1 Tax=Beutenbergia cavernae (strain ATCC BAA-8 / DSM 12333 / CCUG 43141 / JCM 11478 / NBRC 16432 / NCIMB 13614 / HKI 0122) TaxID=471853 RepID=C5C3I3_BEUC1|nr:septum formation family protein [Beutenbergia cavernae]ACQ81892.1 hypothetical protein Bcav_3650 [Beutenbergia cavernae DSM 12333]